MPDISLVFCWMRMGLPGDAQRTAGPWGPVTSVSHWVCSVSWLLGTGVCGPQAPDQGGRPAPWQDASCLHIALTDSMPSLDLTLEGAFVSLMSATRCLGDWSTSSSAGCTRPRTLAIPVCTPATHILHYKWRGNCYFFYFSLQDMVQNRGLISMSIQN